MYKNKTYNAYKTLNNLNVVEVDIDGTHRRFYLKEGEKISHIGRMPLGIVFDQENVSSNIEHQTDVDVSEEYSQGGFKNFLGFDDSYVALKLIDYEFVSKQLKFNDLVMNKLRKFTSIRHSFFVSENNLISYYGGKDLCFHFQNGAQFKLSQFELLTKDLYQMQKEGLFMTDLKPEKLTCKNPETDDVYLIDVDSIVSEKYKFVMDKTPAYTTEELISACDKSLNPVFDETSEMFKDNFSDDVNRLKFQQAMSNLSSYTQGTSRCVYSFLLEPAPTWLTVSKSTHLQR